MKFIGIRFFRPFCILCNFRRSKRASSLKSLAAVRRADFSSSDSDEEVLEEELLEDDSLSRPRRAPFECFEERRPRRLNLPPRGG